MYKSKIYQNIKIYTKNDIHFGFFRTFKYNIYILYIIFIYVYIYIYIYIQMIKINVATDEGNS